MMRQIWIPDEDLDGQAAWVVAIIGNRDDAVKVIGERLDDLEARIKRKDARIAELLGQLATSEELAEQHLREIDSLEFQILEFQILELQFRHMKRAGE